jgi:hypothetical protein
MVDCRQTRGEDRVYLYNDALQRCRAAAVAVDRCQPRNALAELVCRKNKIDLDSLGHNAFAYQFCEPDVFTRSMTNSSSSSFQAKSDQDLTEIPVNFRQMFNDPFRNDHRGSWKWWQRRASCLGDGVMKGSEIVGGFPDDGE